MPYRVVLPGQKVKATDVQLAINQGILQFDSLTERSAITTPGLGMLSRLNVGDKKSAFQVFQTGATTGTTGWVPLGFVDLGMAYGNSINTLTSGQEYLVTYTQNYTVNFGDTAVTIFSTDGTISLPWRGVYLIVGGVNWTEGANDGDRVLEVRLKSGSGARYGFFTETASSKDPTTVMSTAGVVTNTTAGTSTWNFKIWHSASGPINASGINCGLYLLSTVYA
jgi:hypothetical protein